MLHKRYKVAATVLALSWCMPGSAGQSAQTSTAQTSPTQFSLSQVEKRPGTIMISPGYITLIDFPAPISKIVSGNSGLFKTEVFGNRVALSAAKTVGQTDLLVTTGGRIALFVVQIDGQGSAPRRYSVSPVVAAAPRPPAAAPAPVPAARPLVRPAVPPAATLPRIQPGQAAGLLARYEAERAVIYRASPARVAQASGGGHVQQITRIDSRVTFPAIRAPATGVYTLRIRYANGSGRTATQAMWINDSNLPAIQYPVTGGWGQHTTVNVAVALRAGTNTLRLGKDREAVNLDVVELWGLANGAAAPMPGVLTAAVSAPAPAPSSPAATSPAAASPAPLASAAPAPVSAPAALGGARVQVPLGNPGFEEDANKWYCWWDQSLTQYGSESIETRQPRSGRKYLVLSNKSNFKQNCTQTLKGIANGSYTLEMWIRTSGRQYNLTLIAENFGEKAKILEVPIKENQSWVRYSLSDIPVTSGQLTVGIWSSSPGGENWAHIDDVSLSREGAGR